MKTISNHDDIIDSRDIIARIGELESLRDDWQSDNDLPDYQDQDTAGIPDGWTVPDSDLWTEWDESDEGTELISLLKVKDQAEDYAPDWEYGEALIRDSYFKTYARELAEDIGAINRDANWPNNCIDWEQAADELKMDYTEIDFDGVAYWIRS